MKRFFFYLFILFFTISSLNAFEVKFGEGKDYEGFFKPMILNVSCLNYYDNETQYLTNASFLYPLILVKSENFNPYAAHCYVKINDNFTKELNFSFNSANVPPGYINKYVFANKIYPQEFGYNYDYNGFENLLNNIDNITFYIEYEGDTYTYNYDNFSQYVDFFKTYNNSIIDIDTSNYPKISVDINNNDNVSDVGFCVLIGRGDNWNDNNTTAGGKVDYVRKALFGMWYKADNLTNNSIDLSQIPGLIIPALPVGYIAKVKTEIRADLNQENEANNIIRFQCAYKKIPLDKIKPIITVSDWKLLGGCPLGQDIHIQSIKYAFDINKIKTVWAWQNNKWALWSPDANLMELISNYGLSKLNVIYHYQGFWVNFK